MSTGRQKRKPVFDPSALDDELDDLMPARRTPPPNPAAAPPSALAAAPVAPKPGELERLQPEAVSVPLHVVVDPEPRPPASAPAGTPSATEQSPRITPVASGSAGVVRRARPPEVLLASEVYDELYRVQIAEKKLRRGLARPMGVIVMDAIEAHAARLATTWSTNAGSTIGEGQLFERPSSNAVPRRRRHVTAPRTVVLSGVTAANGRRLDNLVAAWGAGTRSALVEQALRYEFGLFGQ